MPKPKKPHDLALHESTHAGPFEVMRVPGGWIYGAMSGMTFVPWMTMTSKTEEMRSALDAVRVWRGIGLDPNEHFEAIGEMFQRDTGWLRPGKSEPRESYYEGREEERQKIWGEWVKKKNQEIDELIISAIGGE